MKDPLAQSRALVGAPISRRFAPRSLLVLVLAFTACQAEPEVAPNVPAIGGSGFCRIHLGDREDMVRLRCGRPCGGGQLEEGVCTRAERQRGLRDCPNRCDVYGHTEVCYSDHVVARLRRLGLRSEPHAPCEWPEPGLRSTLSR